MTTLLLFHYLIGPIDGLVISLSSTQLYQTYPHVAWNLPSGKQRRSIRTDDCFSNDIFTVIVKAAYPMSNRNSLTERAEYAVDNKGVRQ